MDPGFRRDDGEVMQTFLSSEVGVDGRRDFSLRRAAY